MRITRIILFVLLTFPTFIFGQIGNEFWFAAPDVSQQHYNNSIPLMLHITALYNTEVTISRPADPSFTPVVFSLGPQQTQEIQLDALLGVDEIEVYARQYGTANFLQDKGFLITSSPGEITAYYELVGRNNTDIIALKAHNALGRDFWVSTQRKYKNHGYSDDFSGFTVVATKDGTTVTIDPNGNNLQHHGTTPFTVPLNRGQAFAVRAAGQDPLLHIHGIKVTSNNDIAIIIYDDSMQIDDGGGNWDIFADQIVPTEVVGLEYIVLKGNVQDNATPVDGEAIFITPTENGTDIYIDGVLDASGLNAGDYYEYVITNPSTHVEATKPVYVNHITGYSTNISGARELGGAILPPIDKCTGSYSVTTKRTPATGFVYFNNLMVRNNPENTAIHSFTYTINGGMPVPIPASHFTYIMDSAFAVYDHAKAGGAAYYNNVVDGDILRVDNSVGRFHLGIMQGRQSPGCKYGYFSDFAASEPAAGIGGFLQGNSRVYCNLNPIQIVANGGTSYKWYNPTDSAMVDKLDYDTVAAPYFFPDTSGIYYFNVIITGECYAKDTLLNQIIVMETASASFSFDSDEGCSPFSPMVTNLSDSVIGVTQIWTVKPAVGDAYNINQDTVPRTFELPMPENHTDSIQTHSLHLLVMGLFNSCPVTKSKDIKVKPNIEAEFTASDTIGCHPLFVSFDNTSSGNIDSTSFFWDFGDNTQSFDSLPTKTYSNYTLNDTIHTVTLVTTSPFACTDTATQDITIHPRVKVNIAVDTTNTCSPLVSNLSPASSFGVDTLYWYIDYFYNDSSYTATTLDPVTLTHYDTSTAGGPDTLYVQLIGSNRFSCRDTAPIRQLVAYPDVIADFTIDKSEVCDSIPILFTNNSIGYEIKYEWDFGNNTFSQDSTAQSYTKSFFNRVADTTIEYHVQLQATSGYYCEDMADTIIRVHPYIKADFGLNYENNCSPVSTIFSNTSIGSDANNWDFGASTYTDSINSTFTRQLVNNLDNADTVYTIKLVTNNIQGCYDSLSRNVTIFPRVVAEFDFTTISVGCAPLNVGFENKSKGGTLLYTWNFGDNTSSTTSDTTFNKDFNNITSIDTIYTVQLTAKNSQGCDSVVTRPVEVLAFIDAEFNLPVTDSCSPFTIRPDNLSSAGALYHQWDFGDGNTSNDFEPIVPTYLAQDDTIVTRLVRLIEAGANDAQHLACADTHIVSVTIYPELESDFALVNDTFSCQPLMSAINNNTNIIAGTDFAWYIDNKFYSSDAIPPDLNQNNYLPYDTNFTIYLYGRSQYGCRDTATQGITIFAHINSFFTVAPSAICSGDSLTFDQSYASGEIASRVWDYGNGIDNESANRFYHSYTNLTNTPINQEVTLTLANSNGCDSVWRDTVTIYPKVTADFEIDDYEVCYPYNSVFTNNSNNANQAYWIFGDGSTSSDITPTPHEFNNFTSTKAEIYNIRLEATSQYNCFDTITKSITINAKPDAIFYFDEAVSCPPFEVQINNASRGANLTYDWDLGGDATSSDFEPTHIFTNSTNNILDKEVVLIVESDKNCSDTLTRNVSVYPDVDVDFTYSANEGCSPLKVSFTGTDTSNVLQMLWSVDGNPFGTILEPTYWFVNETSVPKTFAVKFEAQSLFACSSDTTKEITIYPSPTAEFIPDPLPADYGTEEDQTVITFHNRTRYHGAWNYKWDYGDGFTNNTSQESFDYAYGSFFWGDKDNGSTVPVTLTAWNPNRTACRDSSSHELIIYPPLPQVDLMEDISGCQPFTVDFGAITKYNYEDDYQWDFGHNNEVSTEKEPVFTFNEAGVYTIKLVVNGDGGTNWDYKIVTVNPKPIAEFYMNDTLVYDSSQTKGYDWINFYNLSRFAKYYSWYFDSERNLGGVPDSDSTNPSWYYDEVGEYFVGLIAMSDSNCSDTTIYPNPIVVETLAELKFPTAFLVSPTGPADEYDTERRNKYVFYPISQGVDEYRLEIYNRWGARVFESREANRGWNGYIDGTPAKQDVYVWRARGVYTNGQPFDMSGDVTLIHGQDEVLNK